MDSPRYSIPILQEDWAVSENNQMEVIRQLIVKAAANIGKTLTSNKIIGIIGVQNATHSNYLLTCATNVPLREFLFKGKL